MRRPNAHLPTLSCLVAVASVFGINACDTFISCEETRTCKVDRDAMGGAANVGGAGGATNAAECAGEECPLECEKGTLDCDGDFDNGCEAEDVGPPGAVRPLRPTIGAFTGSLWTANQTGSLRPTLTWRAASAGSCETIEYQVQLDDSCPIEQFQDCAFESPEVDATTEETQLRPEEDLPVSDEIPVGSRYYWRVRACDAPDHCSQWSDVRYLDVGRAKEDVTGDGYADMVLVEDHGPLVVYAGQADSEGAGPTVSLRQVLEVEPTVSGYAEDQSPVVRFVGDVNGDGFNDFVSTATADQVYLPPNGARTKEEVVAAQVRYLFLGSAHDIQPVPFIAPTWSFGVPYHNFPAGDFNADGYADILASDPVDFAEEDENTPAWQPVVHVFLGRKDVADFPFPEDPNADDPDITGIWTPDTRVTPPAGQTGNQFGINAGAGDFNGDGYPDLLIQAHEEGLIHMVVGGKNPDAVIDLSIPYSEGQTENECRDARIAVGDLNGDAFDDFAVGCWDTRIIDVYYGASTLSEEMGWSTEITEPGVNYYTVSDVALADLDGDGLDEVITGTTRVVSSTPGPGILVFAGAEDLSSTPLTLKTDDAYGYFGAADHNADGHIDLVVPADSSSWVPGDGTLDPDPGVSLMVQGVTLDAWAVAR